MKGYLVTFGVATIAISIIGGSLLMGLGWIGKTLEEIRETIGGELAEKPSGEEPRISKDLST